MSPSLVDGPLDAPTAISLIDIRPASGTRASEDPTVCDIRLDAIKGLSGFSSEKELPGLLLYDEAGLRLFEEITYQPEYYLTGVEIKLLKKHAISIANQIKNGAWVIELGGGSVS